MGLTRRNGPRTHLLQTIRGKTGEREVNADTKGLKQRSISRAKSPDINDAPISSDEDTATSEHEQSVHPVSSPQSRQRSSQRTSETKSRPKRSRDDTQKHGEDDFDFLSSSWPSKRTKRANCYGGSGTRLNGQMNKPNGSEKGAGAGGFKAPPSKEEVDAQLSRRVGGRDFKIPKAAQEGPVKQDKPLFRLPGPEAKEPGFRIVPDDPPLFSSNISSSAPSTGLSLTRSSSSSLSSPPDSPRANGFGERDVDGPTVSGAICPMCKQAVDQSLLETFSMGKSRMGVRQQAQFCRAHRERTAENSWREKRYPKIDWTTLRDRCNKHESYLRNILKKQDKSGSVFRRELKDRVESGKDRTMQQSLMTTGFSKLTPGYYGPKGAQLMTEWILSKFSSQMRALAATDRLISSSGVSGYMQAVLVPELATCLIREDMNLNRTDARHVMAESIEMGDLLNEDE